MACASAQQLWKVQNDELQARRHAAPGTCPRPAGLHRTYKRTSAIAKPVFKVAKPVFKVCIFNTFRRSGDIFSFVNPTRPAMASLQSCRTLPARDAPAASCLASSASPVLAGGSPASVAVPSLYRSRPHVPRLVTCSFSEKEKHVSRSVEPASLARRGILACFVAAGATLAAVSGISMAAMGPGGEGARRTAEKADDLLKAADTLNNEEAPPRFGPGRPGAVKDETKISQIAGSGPGAASDTSK